MTPINLNSEYIDEFTTLTEEVEGTRLVHLQGIQFAILGPINVNLFAFESVALAAYIQNRQPNFRSFRFVQTRKAAGSGPDDEKVLFIWASDRPGIMLSESDDLLSVENQGLTREPHVLASATKAFGLPPNGHLARILLTHRLVKHLETLSGGHIRTIEQILYLMNREFLKARGTKSDLSAGLLVAGEHFIFETRPFNEQITAFDLHDPES